MQGKKNENIFSTENPFQMRKVNSDHSNDVRTNLSSLSNSEAMECPYSHMDNLLPHQTFHHGGASHMAICTVSQPEIVALTPAIQANISAV